MAVGASVLAVSFHLLRPVALWGEPTLGDGVAAGWYTVYLPVTAPPMAEAGAVSFSPERGFFDAAIRLTLGTRTEGALIRYTTDGSVPTLTNGSDYRGPIAIETTTVIRARAFRDAYTPSVCSTHSYIFPRHVVRQPADPSGFPEYWGTYPNGSAAGLTGKRVSADYEMDPQVAVEDPRYRNRIASDLRSLPTMSIASSRDDLFGKERGIYANPLGEGVRWERPASAELIYPDGSTGFQVDCGIRIAGAWSRLPDGTPKHSFSLRFKRTYGPTKLRHELLAGSTVTKFDTLRLRGGQADSFLFFPIKTQYVHDEWGRRTQVAMGWEAPRGTFVHLYLDGLYWGLYNVTEEPTASFAASHLGGEKEDYDVIKDYHQVEDGTIAAYNAITRTMHARDLSPRERYERVAELVDLPQHADYNLLQIYTANRDWPFKNWRAVRNRLLGHGFQFLVWDIEHVSQLWSMSASGYNAGTDGVDDIHGWLSQYDDYRILFADRVRRHLFDGGALTPESAAERYRVLADEVDAAIVPESARWGDGGPAERTRNENFEMWTLFWSVYSDGYPQNRDDHWRPERDRLLARFFPVRTGIVLEQLCKEGLYPRVSAPVVSHYTPSGKTSALAFMSPYGPSCESSRTDGTIYYTTDGSDPREAWTGAVSQGARPYDGPVTLTGFTPVKARQRSNAEWSALTKVVFGTPSVAVTEVMYNPHGGSRYEFIELQNREAVPVDLSLVATSGITYTVPSATILGPGEFLVLARDAAAFGDRYPQVRLGGVYDGKLANEGETITFAYPSGEMLLELTYDDEGYWPLAADGWGRSLVPLDPDGDQNDPENWRASTLVSGSPGAEDQPPPYRRVVVSEVLGASDWPLEDAIELHNLEDAPASVGGWYLSDDEDEPRKYRLPVGTLIAPSGYAVVYAADFGSDPDSGFGLSSEGETVVLTSALEDGYLSGLMAGVEYGASEPGVSWGRHRTSVGLEFVPLAARTFGARDPASLPEFRAGQGAPNAEPRYGPVVVSEIMYDPPGGLPEYVELFNLSSEPVRLHAGDDPALTWRFTEGIGYSFEAGSVLEPHGYLVVAATDPETFRQSYGLGPEVQVLGPFTGRLSDSGELVELARPAEPDSGGGVYWRVDWLEYDAGSEWPKLAAGYGASLERTDPTSYGNEPRNWLALTTGGTPGRHAAEAFQLYLPAVARD